MNIRPDPLGSEHVATRVVLPASFSKTPACITLCVWLLAGQNGFAQTAPTAASAALTPLTAAGSLTPNPVWQLSGLPGNKTPRSTFEVVSLNGETVLALRSRASYGVLTHAWQSAAPESLGWRWRLEQPLATSDIKTKAGDDAALKVCVMLDQPLADIPFLQRSALTLARSVGGQNLPSATLCYLWDNRYPAGTRGPNPFSARVRYIVLNGAESATGQWVSQRRRIADDFALLFGQESPSLPPVIAVAVGADSDNTQGSSLGYVDQLRWLP